MNSSNIFTGKAQEIEITELEFRLLRDFIHDYCGIYFDESKAATFRSRLSFRLKLLGLASFSEYYSFLKHNPESREELRELIPLLTNNETYFFREIGQLHLFVSEILEEIISRKRHSSDRTIKVLSCGCSSGDEIYSLAMLLEEMKPDLSGWDVQLTGIDIDKNILEKAERSRYTGYSLRATEKRIIDKYFKKDGESYVLDGDIRTKASFVLGNLVETGTLSPFQGADAIFCRNVLIYFSEKTIRWLVDNFYHVLADEGYLFLGHSEILARVTDRFENRRLPGAIIYTKKVS